VRLAVEVRNAAAVLVRFSRAVKSLGFASWSLGVGFAGLALGLRFVNGADMAAPEFVACFVFASLLVVFGTVVYIMEARGYISLVADIAGKDLSELNWQELAGLDADGKGGAGVEAPGTLQTAEITGNTSAPN
jgi:hypothetical protein